ncbi:hypothetical protein [Thiogranum longum]|nr:hypothetical protein [Thiogranum longum]
MCASYAGVAGEWSGNAGVEWLAFPKQALSDAQHDSYLSFSLEPEYYHEWDHGKKSFTFEPFLRRAQYDTARTHADIRELNIGVTSEWWELTAGISKVYWGITESQHLVDIVNQTDLVENLDTEDKLGQPMLDLTLVGGDLGTLDLFVLPGFRERTFLDEDGRPRFGLVVDRQNPLYENNSEDRHIDFAARWYQYIGDWEVGLSHFHGTARTPEMIITPTGPFTPPVLTPFYPQIDQTGLEVQGIFGAWLWKLEAIHNTGFDHSPFFAAVGGFEYTFVLENGMEIGALMEYSWDERDEKTPSRFQNDMLVGTRLTFNDVQSTQVLAGVIVDMEGAGHSYNLEAERRFGESWKLSLEARGVFHVEPGDFLYQSRRDNSFRFTAARYF